MRRSELYRQLARGAEGLVGTSRAEVDKWQDTRDRIFRTLGELGERELFVWFHGNPDSRAYPLGLYARGQESTQREMEKQFEIRDWLWTIQNR